jgi:hypothetical protein
MLSEEDLLRFARSVLLPDWAQYCCLGQGACPCAGDDKYFIVAIHLPVDVTQPLPQADHYRHHMEYVTLQTRAQARMTTLVRTQYLPTRGQILLSLSFYEDVCHVAHPEDDA